MTTRSVLPQRPPGQRANKQQSTKYTNKADQGQMLDMQEGQTAKSALRDDWTRNVPHHNIEVVLEVTLEHMCTGLRP